MKVVGRSRDGAGDGCMKRGTSVVLGVAGTRRTARVGRARSTKYVTDRGLIGGDVFALHFEGFYPTSSLLSFNDRLSTVWLLIHLHDNKMTSYIPSLTLPNFLFENAAAAILLPVACGTAVGFSISRMKPQFEVDNDSTKSGQQAIRNSSTAH